MIQLIISALGIAYITRKQYTALQLRVAKTGLIDKLDTKKEELLKELRNFQDSTGLHALHLNEIQEPFALAEPKLDIRKFSRALKYNCHAKKISILARFTNVPKIALINDLAVVEWLDSHITLLLNMIHELYFSYETISYASTGILLEERDLCTGEKRTQIESEITIAQGSIRFIEELLIEYQSKIYDIALNPEVSKEEQDELKKILSLLQITLTTKKISMKNILELRKKIVELEEDLARQTYDWQIFPTKGLLARYRSQTLLDSMELYLFHVLRMVLSADPAHRAMYLEQLGEYIKLQGELEAFHKQRYPSIIVRGEVIFNREHRVFYIPEELRYRLDELIYKFGIPFPDAHRVFEHLVSIDEETRNIPSLKFAVVPTYRPPIPPRPTIYNNMPLGLTGASVNNPNGQATNVPSIPPRPNIS